MVELILTKLSRQGTFGLADMKLVMHIRLYSGSGMGWVPPGHTSSSGSAWLKIVHICIYIYIYIYMCVCVCVYICMCVSTNHLTKKKSVSMSGSLVAAPVG